MTFRIEQPYGGWANGDQRLYESGEVVRVQLSALLGLSSESGKLISLPSGLGFLVVYDSGKRQAKGPGEYAWTNRGNAIGI